MTLAQPLDGRNEYSNDLTLILRSVSEIRACHAEGLVDRLRSMSRLDFALRRALLLKILAKPQPRPEDLESVIELASHKVIEALEVQSMTLYLVEEDNIVFRWVYYSKTLWEENASLQSEFERRKHLLMGKRLPMGTGIVGKTLATGQPQMFDKQSHSAGMLSLRDETGFDVCSMMTVPLQAGARMLGAIQVLNKEPHARSAYFDDSDLALLTEVAEYSAPLIQRMLDADFRCSDTDTARFIASFTDSALVMDEQQIEIDEKVIEVVDPAVVRRTQILPYRRISANSVAALMANPLDFNNRESFEINSDMRIEEISVAPVSLIEKLLKQFSGQPEIVPAEAPDSSMDELKHIIGAEYGLEKGTGGEGSSDALDDEDSAPIIQLANRIIEDAYVCGASDIHIEPQEYELLVRYRVDGVLQEKLRLPSKVASALVARLKVMSDLDIAEKRLPQDGRIVFKKFTRKKMDIDLRVASGPMNFGEKVCMRILDKSKSALPITALGFSEENLRKYRDCIVQPYGMILHCGPTGSGKSMTLFSALREVAAPDVNIHTAEDPIEYTIPGINQMQMHKQIGLTFAAALRCYLRMDPDIILVGEIRDEETAEIAVEAALTGHLLLSTLHTNDAPSTIARLTDMGVEPFMISASMLVICAQRLMRRVCQHCKVAYLPEGNEAEILSRALDGWRGEVFRASKSGCMKCGHNGYKGRVGIHELMVNNEALTRAINNRAETAVLKRIAMQTGMKTLHQDSMLKVKEGTSTILEALANVPPDMAFAD